MRGGKERGSIWINSANFVRLFLVLNLSSFSFPATSHHTVLIKRVSSIPEDDERGSPWPWPEWRALRGESVNEMRTDLGRNCCSPQGRDEVAWRRGDGSCQEAACGVTMWSGAEKCA